MAITGYDVTNVRTLISWQDGDCIAIWVGDKVYKLHTSQLVKLMNTAVELRETKVGDVDYLEVV